MSSPVHPPVQAPAGHPRETAHLPAFRSPAAWVLLIFVSVVALTLDLTTKAWSFRSVAPRPVVIDRHLVLTDPSYDPIPPHPGLHVLPWDLLDLRLVINHGAVFGTGQGRRVFLIGFTIVALIGAVYLFALRTAARQRLAHLAIALIIAGGSGNLFDRVRFGLVRDFLHLMPNWRLPFGWRYPALLGGGDEIFPWVFNLADVMLLTGMGLLLLHIHLVERRRAALARHPQPATAAPASAAEDQAAAGPTTAAGREPAATRQPSTR